MKQLKNQELEQLSGGNYSMHEFCTLGWTLVGASLGIMAGGGLLLAILLGKFGHDAGDQALCP